MTWTIEFEQPARRLSMNDRGSWRKFIDAKKAWRDAAYVAARDLLRMMDGLPPCFVRFTFPVPDNRKRDSDNTVATTKICVDAFVLAGVWPDDSPQYVECLASRFAKGADRVVVELIPREAQ